MYSTLREKPFNAGFYAGYAGFYAGYAGFYAGYAGFYAVFTSVKFYIL